MTEEAKRILLIDDEVVFCEIIGDLIADFGYNVITENSGDAGLEAFRDRQPDMVLVDLNMPGTDGYGVLKGIRESGSDIPVIVISGAGTVDGVVRAINFGAWDFISKPIEDISIFIHKIQSAFEKHRLIIDKKNYEKFLEEEVLRRTESLREEIKIRILAEAELRKVTEAIQQSPSMVIITDPGAVIDYVNPKFCEVTGYSFEELKGVNAGIVKSGVQPADFYQNMLETIHSGREWRGEFHNRKKNGDFFWEYMVISSIKNEEGEITNFVGVGEDITMRKDYEDLLMRQANYDTLTDLPNSILLIDRLTLALAQAARNNMIVALMLLDLDNFKKVNDTMGHDIGDEMIKEVARRLQQAVRSSDTVARFSGDKFFILLTELHRSTEVETIAEKIRTVVSNPFIVEESVFMVTGSIGITTFPQDGDDPRILMRNADAAMYRSKEEGRNRICYFSSELNQRALRRLQVETQLRFALANDEFTLHFQPQINLRENRVSGAECLIRWKNPVLGQVGPDEFIGIAEDTELINPIGEYVLRNACILASKWVSGGGSPVKIAVNISSRQFKEGGFVEMVEDILKESGYPPRFLELEITESVLVTNVDETVDILHRLVRKGVNVSVDDFGTGYSSLSYLKRFPVNSLKIDKSFIGNLTRSNEDAALARAIIAMGHSLGLEVVAEGVENEEQLSYLKKLDCDIIQGYYYSKPIDFNAFRDFMLKW